MNVEHSDATLILFWNNIFGGTYYTIKCCIELSKPLKKINMINLNNSKIISNWINKNSIKTLNIAGPREDGSNIYQQSLQFLEYIFKDFTSRIYYEQ